MQQQLQFVGTLLSPKAKERERERKEEVKTEVESHSLPELLA